jgi:phosphoserine phosphatase RsbU/P
LRRIFQKKWMGAFTLVILGLWILKYLFLTNELRRSLPALLVFGLDLLIVLLAIPAIYYSVQLFSILRRRLLWKISRRLILAHIFVGAIPVLLIVIILYVASLLFYYQISSYLISNQIAAHAARVSSLNHSLSMRLRESMLSSSAPSSLKKALDEDAKYILGIYPDAAVILRGAEPAARREFVLGSGNFNPGKLKDYQVPWWFGGQEFSGLVLDDAQADIYQSVESGNDAHGKSRLYIRSLVFNDGQSEIPFSVEVSVPFGRSILDQLKAAIGQDLLLAGNATMSRLTIMLQTKDILPQNVICSTFDAERDQQTIDRPLWSVALSPFSWSAGSRVSSAEPDVLFVELSTSNLFQNVFNSGSSISQTILGVLKVVVGFFLLVECISLVVGILLTKSITNAVFNLYRGTEFIKRGDFNHRIMLKSDDQLGALAVSFNQMTENIQSLVKERVQKEKLERELEIAKEVQEQLFPRKAPGMEKMELAGLCLPARIVSGDYYDFLLFNPHLLGIALGDISGKGISAALLMANLQATLRSNAAKLMHGVADSAAMAPGEVRSVADLVKMINQQIYNYTSADKFATFFYAVYDELARSLTYCNAGQNPPLYLKGKEVKRLAVGGTVLGMFADADYEQETIRLESGDIFIAYTDGIVESVNEYGEEFGERRLIDLAQQYGNLTGNELQAEIVRHVLSWSHEEERDDDMTLIVAKIR